jgi:hypothetical protein
MIFRLSILVVLVAVFVVAVFVVAVFVVAVLVAAEVGAFVVVAGGPLGGRTGDGGVISEGKG